MSRKRELIEPHKGDKRYVRRDDRGRFAEVDDVSRSLAQDVRKKAKHVTVSGQATEGTGGTKPEETGGPRTCTKGTWPLTFLRPGNHRPKITLLAYSPQGAR